MWPDLAWWTYLVIALSMFIGCLSLNYIVKKINEARLEERFTRISQKASTTQSTQVQGPLIEMETRSLTTNADSPHSPDQGISFVFDKRVNLLDERKESKEDAQNINQAKNEEITIANVQSATNTKEEDYEAARKSESSIKSVSETKNNDDVDKPTFLGNIYKKDDNRSISITKRDRDHDQDSILNELLDKIITKINEDKGSSVTKTVSQNDKDSRD